MEEKIYRCPIRYYSIITVAKDFVSQAGQNTVCGEKKEWPEAEKAIREVQEMVAKQEVYATVVNSLTPYVFLLVETETGAPYWQYLDLAGSLGMVRFTNDPSYVEAEKVVYENGGYMYRIKEIHLQRK